MLAPFVRLCVYIRHDLYHSRMLENTHDDVHLAFPEVFSVTLVLTAKGRRRIQKEWRAGTAAPSSTR